MTPPTPQPAAADPKRLWSTTDARVWAEEFAKVCPEVDQGLMLGWFANAIETGRRAGRSQAFGDVRSEMDRLMEELW